MTKETNREITTMPINHLTKNKEENTMKINIGDQIVENSLMHRHQDHIRRWASEKREKARELAARKERFATALAAAWKVSNRDEKHYRRYLRHMYRLQASENVQAPESTIRGDNTTSKALATVLKNWAAKTSLARLYRAIKEADLTICRRVFQAVKASWTVLRNFMVGGRQKAVRRHSGYEPHVSYGETKAAEPVNAAAVLAEMVAERDQIAALPVIPRDVFHFDWYKVEARKALKDIERAIELNVDSEKRAELSIALGKARKEFAEAVEKSCVIVISTGKNLDKAQRLAAIERRIRNFRRHHEAAESAFKRMTGYEYNSQLFAADRVPRFEYWCKQYGGEVALDLQENNHEIADDLVNPVTGLSDLEVAEEEAKVAEAEELSDACFNAEQPFDSEQWEQEMLGRLGFDCPLCFYTNRELSSKLVEKCREQKPDYEVVQFLMDELRRYGAVVISVHNGTMHADDILACAVYKQFTGKDVTIIRTRNKKLFEMSDIVADVGGLYDGHKYFDHHQQGTPVYPNGVKYSAVGLVLERVCQDPCVKDYLLEHALYAVQAGDNGQVRDEFENPLDCLRLLNVSWRQNLFEAEQDAAFASGVEFGVAAIKQMAEDAYATREMALNKQTILAACDEAAANDRHYIVLNRYMPWQEFVVGYNDEHDGSKILAVVFQSQPNDWKTQVVPGELGSFLSWVKFDPDYCRTLPGFDFCHKERFLAGFKGEASKESAIAAAENGCVAKNGDKFNFFDLQLFAETAGTSSEATTVSENPDLSAAGNSGAESENINNSSVETAKEVNTSTENSEGPSAEDAEAATNDATKASKEVDSMVAQKSDHVNNDRLIEKLTKKEGNFSVQSLQLMPFAAGKLSAMLVTADLPIAPTNEAFVRENVRLWTASTLQATAKRGTDRLLVIDSSAVMDDDNLGSALTTLRDRIFLVPVNGEMHAAIELTGSDNRDDWKFQSLTAQPVDGDLVALPREVVLTKRNNFHRNVQVFGGVTDAVLKGCKIVSPSQGRKCQGVCYSVKTQADVLVFRKMLDAVNLDSFSMSQALLGQVNMTEAAELATRLSAKTTAFALQAKHGCWIPTYAILFGKDENADGSFGWRASLIADNLIRAGLYPEKKRSWLVKQLAGYLVQARPLTVKGAGLVYSDALFASITKQRKLFRIDVNDPKNRKLLAAVERYQSKAYRNRCKAAKKSALPAELQEFDGVIICHNGVDASVDAFFNMDAVKDIHDLKKVSGLNIMAVAHQPKNDWMRARTSDQLLKIYLRLINDYPQLEKTFKKSMAYVMERTLDADFDLSAKPQEFGHELIDCGYVAKVARDLNPNPESMGAFPTVLRGAIEDAKNRVENHLNRDAFFVAGHPGMITVDPVYVAWGRSVLNMDADVVEIYDPVYDRYAAEMGIDDRRGMAIKYPSMGTREVLKTVFISQEEYIRRIMVLGAELGKSETEIAEMIEQALCLKEGAVLIPASLAAIARIAAGLDLDGDKIIIYFIEKGYVSLPEILWMAHELGWKSRAVEIGKPVAVKTAMIKIDVDLFNQVEIAIDQNGNSTVGKITNGFRILGEGMLQKNSDKTRRLFWGMFKNVFGAGSEGSEDYVSPIAVKIIDGIAVHVTTSDVVDRWSEAVRRMRCNDENIQVALDDLDVIGRHVQELTIDAQKNFYKVLAWMIKELAKRGYTLLPFVAAIKFAMNWRNPEGHVDLIRSEAENVGYYTFDKDGVKTVANYSGKAVIGRRKVNVISDSFAPYRNWAATKALERLEALRAQYADLTMDPLTIAKRQDAYNKLVQSLPVTVLHRLELVMRQAVTADRLYKEYQDNLRGTHIFQGMSPKQMVAVSEAIKKTARSKFDEMMANISNELRKVATLA